MAKLEEEFERLEKIISDMESGDLTLDESFEKYEEGMKLVKDCNDMIDKVEKKLIVINEANGE